MKDRDIHKTIRDSMDQTLEQKFMLNLQWSMLFFCFNSIANQINEENEFKEKHEAERKAKEEANELARRSPRKEQLLAAILQQYQRPISFLPAYFRQNQPVGSSNEYHHHGPSSTAAVHTND
jgi:hypothetical protein